MTVTRRRGRLPRGEVAALPLPGREIDLQRQLVGTKPPGLAVIFGWEHIHFRPALTKQGWRTPGSGSMAKGWPDLVLVRERDRRLIFAELKQDGSKLSHDQNRVMLVLRTLRFDAREQFGATYPTIEAYVWRPRDFDEIERILPCRSRSGSSPACGRSATWSRAGPPSSPWPPPGRWSSWRSAWCWPAGGSSPYSSWQPGSGIGDRSARNAGSAHAGGDPAGRRHPRGAASTRGRGH